MESTKSTKIMDHKTMKVEIPSDQTNHDHDHQHHDQAVAVGYGSGPGSGPGPGASGLTRQPSGTKNNCLCSPTTHAGSFRCRLHRAPSLQRTKSNDTSSAPTTKPSHANVTHS